MGPGPFRIFRTLLLIVASEKYTRVLHFIRVGEGPFNVEPNSYAYVTGPDCSARVGHETIKRISAVSSENTFHSERRQLKCSNFLIFVIPRPNATRTFRTAGRDFRVVLRRNNIQQYNALFRVFRDVLCRTHPNGL